MVNDRAFRRGLFAVLAIGLIVECATASRRNEPVSPEPTPPRDAAPTASPTPFLRDESTYRLTAQHQSPFCPNYIVIYWGGGEPDEVLNLDDWNPAKHEGYQVEEYGRFILVPHVFMSSEPRKIAVGFFRWHEKRPRASDIKMVWPHSGSVWK